MGTSENTSSFSHEPVRQVVDVRDYGAKADMDITDSLQAAIDDLGSKGGGTIRIPGERMYQLFRRVYLDKSFITIAGDDKNTTTLRRGTSGGIAVGIQKTRVGDLVNGYASDHYMDMTGIMDGTQGQRYGFRTLSPTTGQKCWMAFQATALSLGPRLDYWQATPRFTVDFAFYEHGTGVSEGVFCGASDRHRLGSPFLLSKESHGNYSGYILFFATGPYEDRGYTLRQARFNPPGGWNAEGHGLHRVSFEIDLETAQIRAWFDRQQVPVDMSQIGPGWRPGLRLTPSQAAPFLMGATGDRGGQDLVNDSGWGVNSTTLDRTYCGLRLSEGSLYADDGVGQSQRRRDGAALTDRSQFYNEWDATSIATIAFEEGPTVHQWYHDPQAPMLYAGPASRAMNGREIDRGYVVSPRNARDVPGHEARCSIRDLRLDGYEYFGVALMLGGIIDFRADRLAIRGHASHGVSQFRMAATWKHIFNGCEFTGWDACYFGANQIVDFTDTFLWYPGRTGFRMIGSGYTVERGFSTEGRHECEYVFNHMPSDYAGRSIIRGFNFNTESHPAPRKAICRHEASPHQGGDRFVFRDNELNFQHPDSAVIELAADSETSVHLGIPVAEIGNNKVMHGKGDALVRMLDPAGIWQVRVDNTPFHGVRRMVDYVHPGPVGRVKGVMDGFSLPPTVGQWARNSFDIAVTDPKPGQYTSWICAKTGTARSPEPPTWIGVDPLDIPGALAGYVISDQYAQAKLTY